MSIQDDQQIFVIRRDFSGGVNTRQHASRIGENQAESLDNFDLGTPFSTSKRPGSVLIGNDVGSNTPAILHNYIIQGADDQLIMLEGTNLWKWSGSGNWSCLMSNMSVSSSIGMVNCKQSGLSPDDVVLIQTGYWQRVLRSNGSIVNIANGSYPPQTTDVMCWYGNRVWTLKNDNLEYSDAYPSNYGNYFNNADFRVPVGEERGLAATRDTGIIVMGNEAIWGIAPSATPAVTDRPEPLVVEHGVVSKRGWVVAGDDLYYFAKDGFRALKRTVQDKLQAGISYPISYSLRTEFEDINWSYIDRLCMEYFDNKIFIAIPTGASSFSTWIYWPATQSFSLISGWSPRCWTKYRVDGKVQLYYGKHGDGTVYQAWEGFTDEGTTTTDGTTITSTLIGREEDFGHPLVYKCGGEIEIESEAAGSDDSLTVYVSIDGGSFSELGTVDLSNSSAPTLPIDLPFFLADSYVVRKKLHLDSLGRFRTLQVKIVNDDANTDPIIVYGYHVITFKDEYESE